MRQGRRKWMLVSLLAMSVLLVPLTAHAFFGTMPVIDWTSIMRIGQQIGVSRQTLNTLGLYVQYYNRINAGVQRGIALERGRRLQALLSQPVGSQFSEFQQLQRDFRNGFADPWAIRQDLETTYGMPTGNFPISRQRRFDAADTTATLGLFDASRMERVSEQEELDANDIEGQAVEASPGGAAKLAAAANGALLRSQAYDHRLLARLMRLQALSIARENSVEKEQEQSRQDQVNTVSSMVGSMQLSYGISDSRGQ